MVITNWIYIDKSKKDIVSLTVINEVLKKLHYVRIDKIDQREIQIIMVRPPGFEPGTADLEGLHF